MAALIIRVIQIYFAAGLVLAVPFLLWGIDRIAPLASGAYAFRPLLIPGVALLWPFVALRWLALERRT